MTGLPNYVAIEGNLNVPKALPGADETGGTEISIWNGLGGLNGSGLIQSGVSLETSATAANYSSWREYCCGDPDSNGYGGAFTPKPGDNIFAQNWYCDAKGNKNINGGYGCSFLHDLTTGKILNCVSPTGSPCWSVQALPQCSVNPTFKNCMTLGLSAEFVIENQSGQCCGSATQFTPFTPKVTMTGSAYSSFTGSYSETISTDPKVLKMVDFTNTTSHMNVSLGTTDQTYLSVSQFLEVLGSALSAVTVKCGNGVGCYSESIAVGPNANGSTIGDAWMLGSNNVGNDFPVYHWVSGQFILASGTGVMLAVSPNGYPWLVNHLGHIYYWNGSSFVLAPGNGCATSIGVGPPVSGLPYGDPWIIGCDGGYHADASIYHLKGSSWEKQSGTGVKIAVSPDFGFPWVINASGGISYWTGAAFAKAPGCATSIAVGPDSAAGEFAAVFGDAWITGCSADGTLGFNVYQMQFGAWKKIPSPPATQIAVSPDLGVPWIINYSGSIYQ